MTRLTFFQENLDVTFIASDGSIKCHSKLLSILSPFFKKKIDGSKNLNGCLEFDYKDYDLKTIKWFMDYCYCTAETFESMNIEETLRIMHFLHAEGKTVLSGTRSKQGFSAINWSLVNESL